MLEIWGGVDSTYTIIAVVFCVVNIVSVPRAFQTIWNRAVCGASSFDCQRNYFPVNHLQLLQKAHYFGNDQEKPQEDTVRLMRQLLCSPSGNKGIDLEMPVHLL